jgi:hypothetical protein
MKFGCGSLAPNTFSFSTFLQYGVGLPTAQNNTCVRSPLSLQACINKHTPERFRPMAARVVCGYTLTPSRSKSLPELAICC